MERCVECHKRCWPWGSGLQSPRYGWIHVRCLDLRLQREAWEDVFRALIKEFRVRSGQAGENPNTAAPTKVDAIPPPEKIH
jgi:hypothetical protein